MAKQALKIIKGTTFSVLFRYESPKKTYVPITGISRTAPVVITAAGHSMPSAWRVKVTDVLGMTDINSKEDYREATALTGNTIEINSINAVSFKDYASSGIIEYNEPVDLTGFTARMQVRATIDSEAVLLELTTGNGGIVLDTVNSTVSLLVSASVTELITWDSGVYSLELVSGTGVVTTFLEGAITTIKEVTR